MAPASAARCLNLSSPAACQCAIHTHAARAGCCDGLLGFLDWIALSAPQIAGLLKFKNPEPPALRQEAEEGWDK
jgi:hypothetical protein